MDIAIMVEGQNGLTWPRWQKLAERVEGLGFAALYRSDHFTNGRPPDLESLECWTSLTWLASHTERIEFGTLVSPASFRHPAMLARFAASVDDLSGGRLRLGLGAGWQPREHENFSFDLLETKSRFDRFEEALDVVTSLLRSPAPLTFSGKYFTLKEAVVLPVPQRSGSLPIVIGGNGPRRTLPLVARYADEWNALFISAEEFAARNALLDGLIEGQGRDPGSVRRSLMTGCFFGGSEGEVNERLSRRGRTLAESRAAGLVIGTAADFVAQLKELEKAGAERVMLQWLDLDDLARLEGMARAVLPEFD